MDIKDRVILFKPENAIWHFDDKPKYMYKRHDHEWWYQQYFDPFPCYSHNRELVIELAQMAESLFPIKFKPYYFLLPNDTSGRTNGWADRNNNWDDNEKNGEQSGFRPNITLAGKVIPLHPAMTKYLLAHEYSHCVDYWIQYKMGIKDDHVSQFDKDYANLRDIECCDEYGGLRWHKNIGEIIANDIRICIFNAEIDFWPHDCQHPLKNPKIANFWKEMKEKYSYRE